MATMLQGTHTGAGAPSAIAATDAVSLEDYLRTSYRPDRDWVDGALLERNMGVGPHAVVQKFLTMFLGVREEEWGILVLTEQRVQVSETHFRIPDLCVVRGDQSFEIIVRTPPLLCVEILSRDDSASDMMERIDDYRMMGVRTVWMIDPRRRTASVIDEHGTFMSGGAELTIPGTRVRLGMDELFAQLNRLEGR